MQNSMQQTIMPLDSYCVRSSDAAIIMGVDPDESLIDLFVEAKKVTKAPKKPVNSEWLIIKNDVIRKVSGLIGAAYSSKKMRHKKYDFIEASIDGIDEEHGSIIMIRSLGNENHDDALNGIIAEKYKAIIQHNLMVTQQKVGHFISINSSQIDCDEIATVEVKADIKYQRKLLKKEIEWFNAVISDICPVEIKHLKLAETYRQAKIKYNEAKKEVEDARNLIDKEIKFKAGAKSIDLGLVKVITTLKSGIVDYDELLRTKGIDESEKEKFRGKQSEGKSFILASPSRQIVLTNYL